MPQAKTEPKVRRFAWGKGARGAVWREDDLLAAVWIFLSVGILVAAGNVNRVAALREKISHPPLLRLFPSVGLFLCVIFGRSS